jgi:hypothetical protein
LCEEPIFLDYIDFSFDALVFEKTLKGFRKNLVRKAPRTTQGISESQFWQRGAVPRRQPILKKSSIFRTQYEHRSPSIEIERAVHCRQLCVPAAKCPAINAIFAGLRHLRGSQSTLIASAVPTSNMRQAEGHAPMRARLTGFHSWVL